MKIFRLSAAISLTLACQPASDIGSICTLPNPDGGPGLWTETSPSEDVFYNGTSECQNEVCLRPAGSVLDAGLGYCSNACTPTNPQDPNSSSPDCAGASVSIDGMQEPMVCRTIALDQAFLNALGDGGAALLEEYLGETSLPVLCTTPSSQGT